MKITTKKEGLDFVRDCIEESTRDSLRKLDTDLRAQGWDEDSIDQALIAFSNLAADGLEESLVLAENFFKGFDVRH